MKIIGHTDVLKKLEKLSKLNNIPPLLFYGQFGIGKASCALYFCALSNPGQSEKVLKLVHPDIIILTIGDIVPFGPRPEDFDNFRSISIDQVRSLKTELQKPPIYARRRFVIIMDADMLTIEAQNSLLKIIEEQEKRTTFILITSNYTKILPTIISRTIKVSFKSLNFEDFKSYDYYWKYDLELLYEVSEGSIGVAKILNSYPLNDWIKSLENNDFVSLLESIGNSKDIMNFLRVFRYYFKRKYIETGDNNYYKLLKKSIEIEDIVRRHGSIEGSLVSLFFNSKSLKKDSC